MSISQRTQLMASAVLAAVLAWSALTSYNYIFSADILAAKDLVVAKAQKNFGDVNQQFEALKNDVQKSTMELEQRQIYLQQLMDEDKSLSNNIIMPDGSSETKPQVPSETDGADKASELVPLENSQNEDILAIYSEHQKNLNDLKFSIQRIETQQQLLAQKMLERISNKISYVENTLTKSGIKADKLMKLAANRPSLSLGMGGPFIIYSENNNFDLSASEPFAKLFSRYGRLIDLESAVQHIPIGIPTKKYYISSPFGIRKDPFKKTWARHHGIDMAGWWKNPIYATADGTVTRAGVNGAYGNFIEIDHGDGFKSRYGHLSKILVKKGDHVTLEQKIGLMGSTGRSTSPHLHYEIWFNGTPINPSKIFKASNNVLKIQQQDYGS